MAVKTRVEMFEREIQILLDEALSPEAQSAHLAKEARVARDEALRINRNAMEREPQYETFVDGRKGVSLESVKPDGVIVFEFDILLSMFGWIAEQLVQHSPVGMRSPEAPSYIENHVFFADGRQVIPGEIVPEARQYVFMNTVPYAGKIERGLSPQAPDGVYQVVAKMASAKFGGIARIQFSYRVLAGSGQRQPAIIITMRQRAQNG